MLVFSLNSEHQQRPYLRPQNPADLYIPLCHLPSHCHGPNCNRHLYLLGLSARLPRITHDSMPSSEDLDRSSLKPISDGLLS